MGQLKSIESIESNQLNQLNIIQNELNPIDSIDPIDSVDFDWYELEIYQSRFLSLVVDIVLFLSIGVN